jgi:hypothetical protein
MDGAEQGSAGGGGRYDYSYFTDAILQDYAKKAVDQALTNLAARPAPAGNNDRRAWARLAGYSAARSDRSTVWKAISTAREAPRSAVASANALPHPV